MPFQLPSDIRLTEAPAAPKRNAIVAGLSSGIDDIQGMLGSAVGGVGGLIGSDALRDWGKGVSDRNQQESAANGRPDLDIAPWQTGGASVLPWAGYQIAKLVPTLAAFEVTGKGLGRAGLVPKSLAAAGEATPTWMGGAGLGAAARAGATEGELAVAKQAGQHFAERATGGAAFSSLTGYGQMMQQARAASPTGEVDEATNLKALALAPVYGAMDSLALNLPFGKSAGGLVSRVALGAARDAAFQIPKMGMQTALTLSFRDDMSAKEKFEHIVDASLTGGAIGAIMGGAGGVRAIKHADPTALGTGDIQSVVDQALQLPAPEGAPAGPQDHVGGPTVNVDSSGRAAEGIAPLVASNAPGPAPLPMDPLQPALEYSGTVLPKQGSLRWAKEYPQSSGPFQSAPHDQLSNMADTMEAYLAGKDPASFTDRDQKVADQYALVQEELNHRASHGVERGAGAEPEAVGAVEREAAQQSGGADRSPAPAPAPFSVDETLKGVGSNATIRKALAGVSDADEARAIVTKHLEEGGSSAGAMKVAERLGIDLNEPGKPAAANDTGPSMDDAVQALLGAGKSLSDTNSKATEPGKGQPKGGDREVDAGFQKKWAQDLKDLRGVKQHIPETPANADEAKLAVYDALGKSVDKTVDGYAGLETLAQKLGLYDANGDHTDEFKRIALKRASDDELTGAASATEAGRRAPDAFARGARGEDRKQFNDLVEMAAHKDGQEWAATKGLDWAAPGISNAEIEKGITSRVADADGHTLTSRDIPEGADKQRFLNQAVDQVYGGRLDPSAHAQLKRLVASGAEPHELDEAARYIETGRGALIDENPKKEFRPATVDPSMRNSPTVRARLAAARDADSVAARKRADFQSLTSTEQAEWLRQRSTENKSRLVNELTAAREAGAITPREHVGLLMRLHNGDIQPVEDRLANTQVHDRVIADDNPIRDRSKWAEVMGEQRGILSRVADIRKSLEEATAAKDPKAIAFEQGRLQDAHNELGVHEAVWGKHLDQWDPVIKGEISEGEAFAPKLQNEQLSRREFLSSTAAAAAAAVGAKPLKAEPITPAKPGLEERIKAGDAAGALQHIQQNSPNPIYRVIAAKLGRGDWDNVHVAVGDENSGLRGLTTLQDDGSSTLQLFGKPGMNEETFLHEAIHAFVQQRWAGTDVYNDHNKALLKDATDRSDATIKGFVDLWRDIGSALRETNPHLADEKIFAQEMLGSPDEMLSWVMTNPEAQAFLKTVDRNGQKISTEPSLWQRFTSWLGGLFGLPSNAKTTTALDNIMSAGMSVLDAGKGVSNDFAQKMAAGIAAQREGRVAAPARMQNAQVREDVERATKTVQEHISADAAKGLVRKSSLYFAAENAISEHYGPWFETTLDDGRQVNGLKAREEAMATKHSLASRFAQSVTEVQDRIDKIERTDRSSHAAIQRLMQLSEHGLNPLRPWDAQLEEVKASKNAANLKKVWQDAQSLVRSLSAKDFDGGKAIDVYHDLRTRNDIEVLSQRASQLHLMASADKFAAALPAFKTAPTDLFLARAADAHLDLKATETFWRDTLNAQLKALTDHIGTQRSAADRLAGADQRDAIERATYLSGAVVEAQKMVKTIEALPNFHLGRNGDYFVSMQLRKGEDGRVDPTAMATAAEHLKDFGKVVSVESDHPKIYIRVETPVQQKALTQAAQQLQQRGIVDAGGVLSGKRGDKKFGNSLMPTWVESFIAKVNSNDTIAGEDKERMIEAARRTALDLMPDNSLALMMAKRQDVPGYDPNMYRSYFTRLKVGIDAHVGMAVAPKITEAFTHMRAAERKAQEAPLEQVPINQRNGMTDVINEVSKRDLLRTMQERTPVIDTIRRATNTFALAMSPAFVTVQLIQPWQTTLPKLGSRHGFTNSARAMASVTPEAFRIMRAVFQHGLETSGSRALDAIIDQQSLQKAGVSQRTAEYLMHLANTGLLDIGGPTHSLTREVDGSQDSTFGKVQRFGSAAGYYAETFTRLQAALAQRKLDPSGTEREAAVRAGQLLKDTMWNYAQDNQGRAFGKNGMFGARTPMFTQFMTYTSQLVQRLYLEMHHAIAGDTPQAKSEARKFLLGHMAMTSAFAGTLGLPFATAIAAAYDNVKDAFAADGEEPSNVRADYHHWLASVFGEGVGDVISRGAPRAAGIDLSSRVGEQDIAPFSKFLTDRRAWKDSWKDLEARSWGAPASIASNMVQGMGLLSDGNVMEGMAKMLPIGLAGVVKAASIESNGAYVDAQGRKLPLSPEGGAVIAQLLGFQPADKAKYNEQASDIYGRGDQVKRAARTLQNDIIKALESGDHDRARELIVRAQEHDRNQPAHPVLSGLAGRFEQRQQQEAVSRAMGVPLGVKPQDFGARSLTAY